MRLTVRPTSLIAILVHSRGVSMARRFETFARRSNHGAYSSGDRITGIQSYIGRMSKLAPAVMMAAESCPYSLANANSRSSSRWTRVGNLLSGALSHS